MCIATIFLSRVSFYHIKHIFPWIRTIWVQWQTILLLNYKKASEIMGAHNFSTTIGRANCKRKIHCIHLSQLNHKLCYHLLKRLTPKSAMESHTREFGIHRWTPLQSKNLNLWVINFFHIQVPLLFIFNQSNIELQLTHILQQIFSIFMRIVFVFC